jgi:hypothetical protein
VGTRNKTFVFDRFHVVDPHTGSYFDVMSVADSEGEWVKAQDAIDRDESLKASRRVLELQNKELREKCDSRGKDLALLLRQVEPSTAAKTVLTPQAFNVHVAKLCASNGTTYVVCIDRTDMVVDMFRSTGRITPFESANEEHAYIERAVWDRFLNGDGNASHVEGMRAAGDIPAA